MKYSIAEAQFRSWLAEVARASPLHTTVDFGESKSLVAVVESNFTITARDPLGQPRLTGGDRIAVEINASDGKVSARASGTVTARITDNRNGSYTVFYCVPQTGEYLVSVLVGGIAITGSPFTVNAVWPRTPTAEISFKESVNCVARGSDDLLYVAFNDHVRVMKLDGSEVRRWGSKGKGDGRFTNLRLVAVDRNWVVTTDIPFDGKDKISERMQLFTPDGTFVRGWPKHGIARGIAIDNGIGQIFAGDADEIKAFNLLGDLLDWGTTRDGEQGRYGGLALHTGPPRRLYATDRSSHQVQAFDSDSKCVSKWGRGGEAPGEFFGPPRCVAVGVSGLVFVSDLARVYAFRHDGTFQFSLPLRRVISMVQMASGAIVCTAIDRKLIVF